MTVLEYSKQAGVAAGFSEEEMTKYHDNFLLPWLKKERKLWMAEVTESIKAALDAKWKRRAMERLFNTQFGKN